MLGASQLARGWPRQGAPRGSWQARAPAAGPLSQGAVPTGKPVLRSEHMSPTTLFTRFDPQTGEVPEYLAGLADRARFMLRERTEEETLVAEKRISWMRGVVEDAKFDAQEFGKLIPRKKVGDRQVILYSPSPTAELLAFIEQPELLRFSENPAARHREIRKTPWHIYFATLALVIIAEHVLQQEEVRARDESRRHDAPHIDTGDDEKNGVIEHVTEALTGQVLFLLETLAGRLCVETRTTGLTR